MLQDGTEGHNLRQLCWTATRFCESVVLLFYKVHTALLDKISIMLGLAVLFYGFGALDMCTSCVTKTTE